MSQHIGERLRRARESRSLSLENISQEIFIKVHYLEALEAGDFDALPSQAQARGFLRIYASYLELDPDESVAASEEGRMAPEESVPVPQTPPVITASAPETAETIFAEVGQTLKTHRELLGFSLEDVEQNTHLRVHYLKALEDGRVADLPSPVQGRGMLSNYAKFLGMDADSVLLRFADGLQADLAVRQSSRPRSTSPSPVSTPSIFRRLISGDLLFGGVLILALVAFVIWGAIRISTVQSDVDPQPTAPPIAEILLPSPVPTEPQPTPTATANGPALLQPEVEEVAAQPTEGPPEQGDVPVQIYIVVRQRAWMRVLVDGGEAFSGRVIPGGAYTFSGDEQVEILTGNGAGLVVYYNQQNLGPLGFYGEVVNQIYTLEGILEPTPTQTLTPTATPLVTPTPTEPTT
jgi:cytoskeletal protein RodZ